MKKLLTLVLCVLMLICVVGCGENSNPSQSVEQSSQSSESVSVEQSSAPQVSSAPQSVSTSQKATLRQVEAPKAVVRSTEVVKPTLNANPKVFLAGDSTVKTYEEDQFIAGWGQYLQYFLNADSVTVVNKSNGGRSSRSFINEGRLFENDSLDYVKLKYTSIESEISAGDYLLIQFGHNDDMTRNSFDTYIERQVQIGEPDKDGVYPTVVPTEMMHKNHVPADYLKAYEYNQAMINAVYSNNGKYGDYHYAADQGTFKGYLKMYVDFARSKGAIPILCTPVARVKFDSKLDLLPGAGRHGANLEYVVAVRQLAQECDCLLIDTFDFSKTCLETAAKNANNAVEANYLMALKPNSLKGEWPTAYDSAFGNKDAGCSGIEGTHYNKYGAYLQAAFIAESLKGFVTESKATTFEETITFGDKILTTPTTKISAPTLMQSTTTAKLLEILKVVQA